MREPKDGITLELLVNTVLRLREVNGPNHSGDRFKEIDDSYLLLKNCRDRLDRLRKEDEHQISLSEEALKIVNQETIPLEDALKQILGTNDTPHYRKRFEKYINHADPLMQSVLATRKEIGVPVKFVPEVERRFWAWNEVETRKTNSENAQKPRKRKKSLDQQKKSSLSRSK